MPPKKKRKAREANIGMGTATMASAVAANGDSDSESRDDGASGDADASLSNEAAMVKLRKLYGCRFVFCPIEGLLCKICRVRIKASLVRETFRKAIDKHVNSARHKEQRNREAEREQEKRREIAYVIECWCDELNEWASQLERLEHQDCIRTMIEQSLGPAEECLRCKNPDCLKLINPSDGRHAKRNNSNCKGFRTESAWGRRSEYSELVPNISWPKYVSVTMDADNQEVPFDVGDSSLEAILDEAVYERFCALRASRFEAKHGTIEKKLGKGAHKTVYKSSNPREVLAIIDTQKYGKNHMEIAIYEMLNQFECPHIIRFLGYTCSHTLPNEPRLKEDTETETDTKSLDDGPNRERYRCIVLECANAGDLQTYIQEEYEKWKNNDGTGKEATTTPVLPPDVVLSIFFQILVALHVAAESFGIKHNDMKPNNILIHRESPPDSSRQLYRIDETDFLFTLHGGVVAKLNDFGHSEFWIQAGTKISVDRFGTLQYCPIDVFLSGSYALQGHHRDMFCLGLILLNLAAGRAHYELQREAPCPPNLKKEFQTIVTGDADKGVMADLRYSILPRAMGEHLDESFNTFYFYLVLFGFDQIVGQPIAQTPLCKAIIAMLNGPDKVAFEKDRMEFSLTTGRNRHIALAREVLSDAGVKLVYQLCAFDRNARPRTRDIFKNAEYLRSFRDCINLADRPTSCNFAFPPDEDKS